MPHLTLTLSPAGPLLDVKIGVSKPRQEALIRANAPVPQPVDARLLIDTGASGTCIDSRILSQLSLTPTGQVPIHTPSTGGGSHLGNQFDVSVSLQSDDFVRIFVAVPVIESNLSSQNIDGLLGRDILAQCLFIYSGTDRIFMLSI